MTIQNAAAWTSRDMAAAVAFVHSLIRKPAADQHAWLLSSECQELWRELCSDFDGLPGQLEVSVEYNDYAERYIATFDVGTPAPPVPLIESHYNKRDPIPRILHENILFYRQFGLQLRDSALESADHLRHQLEFVRHLLEYRAQLETDKQVAEAGQVTQALQDYASRHLISWLPEAISCAEEAPLAFAKSTLTLANVLAQIVIGTDDSEPSGGRNTRLKEVQPCLD